MGRKDWSQESFQSGKKENINNLQSKLGSKQLCEIGSQILKVINPPIQQDLANKYSVSRTTIERGIKKLGYQIKGPQIDVFYDWKKKTYLLTSDEALFSLNDTD